MDFYQEYITTIHDFCIDKERLVKRIDELKAGKTEVFTLEEVAQKLGLS